MISGILLAGGKSTRMGEDKAFIDLDGKPLFSYSLEVLKKFAGDILISSGNERFREYEYPVIDDEIKGIGPMGGIYSCLKKIRNNKAIVLACDMPFISPEYIKILINKGKDKDLCIPVDAKDRPVPTIGIYSRNVIPLLEKQIRNNNYKLSRLLALSNSAILASKDMEESFLFNNINTPEELQKAKIRLSRH